jgi:hypothetical protein
MDYIKHNINKQDNIVCPICRHIVINMPTRTYNFPTPPMSPVVYVRGPRHTNNASEIENEEWDFRPLVPLGIFIFLGINLYFTLTMQ